MIGREVNDEGEREPSLDGQSPHAESLMDSQNPPVVRSFSPPVPALMRKLTGLLHILCLYLIARNNTDNYSTLMYIYSNVFQMFTS